MAQAPNTLEARYVSAFEGVDEDRAPHWLRQRRRDAIAHFERSGFPTARRGNEPWKYTDVRPIASTAFEIAPSLEHDRLASGIDLAPYDLPCPRVHQLVFVDGRYAAELSTEPPAEAGLHAEVIGKHEEGLVVGRLAENLDELPLVEEHLARHATTADNAFTALNTAYVQDGALVFIPDGVFVPEPIHLLFITTARAGAAVTYPRVLIVAGAGSRATVLQSFESTSEPAPAGDTAAYFTNSVTEVIAQPNALLRLYRLQREDARAYHVATTAAAVDRGATVASVTVDLGGALVRHDQTMRLTQPGAGASLHGVYVGQGAAHVDNHTFVDHQAPETSSNEVYKGILADQSHGVFAGQMTVRKDAQRVDAHQLNKNLLLSDAAKMDTQPKLEIFADDVKCTHGATVGRIDEDALFYLNSRGLNQQEARQLLVHGFVTEVIEAIEDEAVRQYVDESLVALLDRSATAGSAPTR